MIRPIVRPTDNMVATEGATKIQAESTTLPSRFSQEDRRLLIETVTAVIPDFANSTVSIGEQSLLSELGVRETDLLSLLNACLEGLKTQPSQSYSTFSSRDVDDVLALRSWVGLTVEHIALLCLKPKFLHQRILSGSRSKTSTPR